MHLHPHPVKRADSERDSSSLGARVVQIQSPAVLPIHSFEAFRLSVHETNICSLLVQRYGYDERMEAGESA